MIKAYAQEGSKEFQFLIGRIEISLYAYVSPFITGFQFLIGRIEIGAARLNRSRELVFQFLIGRIEMVIMCSVTYIRLAVSIPYR